MPVMFDIRSSNVGRIPFPAQRARAAKLVKARGDRRRLLDNKNKSNKKILQSTNECVH
jgi:hypothetical protein